MPDTLFAAPLLAGQGEIEGVEVAQEPPAQAIEVRGIGGDFKRARYASERRWWEAFLECELVGDLLLIRVDR